MDDNTTACVAGVVLTQLRVMGAWHFALMVPALDDAVTRIKSADDQGESVRSIHSFAREIANNPDFARKLITLHNSPVTYRNWTGAAVHGVQAFKSPAQQEAYKRLTRSTKHDDLTVQLLQLSAQQVIKVNENMSHDLLEGKDGNEHSKGKSGDNMVDERFFGKMDWRTLVQRMMKEVRKQALCMWETNGTLEYLRSLGDEEALKLVGTFARSSVTDAAERKAARDEKAARQAGSNRDYSIIATNMEKLAEKEAMRSLPEGVERWTAANFDSKFAELEHLATQVRRESVIQQWDYLKAWSEKATGVRMGAAPQKAAGVDRWRDALRAKVFDEEFMQAIEDVVRQASAEDVADVPGVLGGELSSIPATELLPEEKLSCLKRKIAESAKDRTRSTKHRQEDLYFELQHPRTYTVWFHEELNREKKKRKKCEGISTALGGWKGRLFPKRKRRRVQ